MRWFVLVVPLLLALFASRVEVCLSSSSTVSDVFSVTYAEADAKFTDACQSLRLNDSRVLFATFRNPSASGPNGESLRMRVCVFGDMRASANTVLLSLSGVHGAELFAGSALQLRIMRAMLQKESSFSMPEGVKVVFIHAVSPWGAAWGFKENEENIDMLKNLNGIYTVAAQHPTPILIDFLDALSIPNFGNPAVLANAPVVFQNFLQQYGQALIMELSYGQNQRMMGMSYYGVEASWEKTVLESVSQQYLSGAQNILLLDLHSAAGPFGNWFMAGYDETTDTLLRSWHQATQSTALVEPIYEAGVGLDPWPFYDFVKDMFPSANFARMVWEAGTFPQDQYQFFLVLGIYCRFISNIESVQDLIPGVTCQLVHEKIKEYFYPATDNWKTWTFGNMSAPVELLQFGLVQMMQTGSPPSSGGGLSRGAIAGIVIGSLVGLTIVVAAVWYFFLTKKKSTVTRSPYSHSSSILESQFTRMDSL